VDDAQLREELEQLALSGEGFAALLRRLSVATGRVVRLIAVHGGLLATSEDGVAPPAASQPASGVPASESLARGLEPVVAREALADERPKTVEATDGMRAVALPLHAGPRRVGLLLVEAPIDDTLLTLARAATVPLAIEAVRRDAEATARAESAVRLVEELRFGTFRNAEQLVRAAQRFGLQLDQPHAAAVFAYDGTNTRTWHTAIHWIEMPVYEDEGQAWTVLAGNVGNELRRIRARIEGIVGDAPVLAASGPLVSTPPATAWSFREAEMALALLRNRDTETVLAYDELGLPSLLLSVPVERLQAFVDAALGPILDRPELVETLRAWYASNGSRAGVADRLGIHRNSVGYRIGRIRELLGADPLNPDTARALQAALDAQEVATALGRR
jgi:DNA-binding PucR family transcriptional regulator